MNIIIRYDVLYCKKLFKHYILNLITMLLQDITYGFLAFNLIYLFFWLMLCVIIAVYVYNDAKNRHMNALLWVLIVLFTGIFGLIIYLLVRSDKNFAFVDEPKYERKR